MNITKNDIIHMEDNSRTRNHFKYRLRYHVIFSTKFKKKILEPIKDDVFAAFDYAIYNAKFTILTKNIDKDHIHMILEIPPTETIGDCIHRLKQMTTYYLYKHQFDYLRKFYWGKKHLIWTHGYFVSTIGQVSENVVWEYIKNQGNN